MSLRNVSLILFAAVWLVACDQSSTADTNPAASQAQPNHYSLEGYRWRLNSVVDSQQQALPQIPTELLSRDKGITLLFKDQRLLVDGLCNHISNSYEISNQQLKIGQGISTMKACPESALMMAEQYLGGQLPKLKQYQFDHEPPRLQLTFDDNSQWQLQGELTLSAQYGEPETIFYEVRAIKPSCPNGLPAATECLTLREVFYNEQGIKTHEGEWHIFTETIEGYQHQTDIHTILRIHRYSVPATNTAKASKRYVLDMPVMVSKVSAGNP